MPSQHAQGGSQLGQGGPASPSHAAGQQGTPPPGQQTGFTHGGTRSPSWRLNSPTGSPQQAATTAWPGTQGQGGPWPAAAPAVPVPTAMPPRGASAAWAQAGVAVPPASAPLTPAELQRVNARGATMLHDGCSPPAAALRQPTAVPPQGATWPPNGAVPTSATPSVAVPLHPQVAAPAPEQLQGHTVQAQAATGLLQQMPPAWAALQAPAAPGGGTGGLEAGTVQLPMPPAASTLPPWQQGTQRRDLRTGRDYGTTLDVHGTATAALHSPPGRVAVALPSASPVSTAHAVFSARPGAITPLPDGGGRSPRGRAVSPARHLFHAGRDTSPERKAEVRASAAAAATRDTAAEVHVLVALHDAVAEAPVIAAFMHVDASVVLHFVVGAAALGDELIAHGRVRPPVPASSFCLLVSRTCRKLPLAAFVRFTPALLNWLFLSTSVASGLWSWFG